MIEAAGQLHETLALVAPGTVLRDGLERILRGRTGAIIVLGFDPVVEAISSGGFHLDVELSAARLRDRVGRTSDRDELAELAAIVESSGVIADVEKQIADLTESGLAHLSRAGIDGEVANTLRDLAIRATERRA